MKHLRKVSDIQILEDSLYPSSSASVNYLEPSVTEIGGPNNIVYNYRKKQIDEINKNLDPTDYLSIYVVSEGDFSYTVNSSESKPIEYSLNDGEWTTYSEPIHCNAKDIIKLRGNNTNYRYTFIKYSGDWVLYGNSDSLINSDKSQSFYVSSYNTYTFYSLFENNSTLLSIRKLLINTNKQYGCYCMFYNCVKLTDVVETLPIPQAGITNSKIFGYMFSDCKSITDASYLTITANCQYCCTNMFRNCFSLQYLPKIIASGTSSYKFDYMFYNCTNLKKAYDKLPVAGGQYDFNNMFHGCLSLSTAPKLPNTICTHLCTSIFYDCASLTSLPNDYFDNIISIADYGLTYAFSNCINLKNVPDLPNVRTLPYGVYTCMFSGCSNLTSVGAIRSYYAERYAFSSMFDGCTSLTDAPVIRVNHFYNNNAFADMFCNCKKLNSIIILANTLPEPSFWLNGVASSGTISVLPGLTNAENICPEGWNIVRLNINTLSEALFDSPSNVHDSYYYDDSTDEQKYNLFDQMFNNSGENYSTWILANNNMFYELVYYDGAYWYKNVAGTYVPQGSFHVENNGDSYTIVIGNDYKPVYVWRLQNPDYILVS